MVVLIMVALLIFLSYIDNEKSERSAFRTNTSVIEFPPKKMCRVTGGEWKAVDSDIFPVNPEQGIYSPTTNPEINYKCFCPAGKKWDETEGCK